MEHISNFIAPALDTIMREQIICDLITELRAARSLPPFPLKELEIAGFAWDKILAPIHADFLASRDQDSLFVEAARRGYIEAAQIWEMWESSTGQEERLQVEAEAQAQRENSYATEPAPVGEGRRELLAYLDEKGIGEEQLAAMGRI